MKINVIWLDVISTIFTEYLGKLDSKSKNSDLIIGIISVRSSPQGLNDDQEVEERREKVSCILYFTL
jgi:hypothetical protein